MSIGLKGVGEVEAWSSDVMLPTGWHKVTIESAEEGTTSNGNPQIEMQFAGGGGTIRDWLVVIEKTMGKVAQLLDAVRIDRTGIDAIDAKMLEKRSLYIYVGEEPDQKNPGKTRRRVQSYAAKLPDGASLPADTNGLGGSGPEGADEDIPF
jgi:hypothetical protein